MTSTSNLVCPESCQSGSLRFSTLSEWLLWQESLHFTAIELGLDRCLGVATEMGLLEPDYQVISVAGTNGKGSSVAMLDLILRNSGYHIGCYTSPHLIRYNERICINGKEVTDDQLCESFDRIDRARRDISLTYFEFGTLAALDIFRSSNIDLAILEVGLGGRLDAVNILDADVALVTSIDLDHQQWLGNDRDSIAREKAGIFRSTSPAVSSNIDTPQSLVDYAGELGAPLYLQGKDFHIIEDHNNWSWYSADAHYADLPKPARYSDFQVYNAAGVLMTLTLLNSRYPVEEKSIRQGLQDFRLNGRFQIIPGEIQIILDVAHNHQAATALVDNLQVLPNNGTTHVLIGMLKDKDRSAVFEALSPIVDVWHTVTLAQERGADAETLASELKQTGLANEICTYESVTSALDIIRADAKQGDRLIVTGSFLTVGAAIQHLNLPG
jgi:dihydrofolate synthase/folylpolyglutamate synthase